MNWALAEEMMREPCERSPQKRLWIGRRFPTRLSSTKVGATLRLWECGIPKFPEKG
jgi:hypothetical protein